MRCPRRPSPGVKHSRRAWARRAMGLPASQRRRRRRAGAVRSHARPARILPSLPRSLTLSTGPRLFRDPVPWRQSPSPPSARTHPPTWLVGRAAFLPRLCLLYKAAPPELWTVWTCLSTTALLYYYLALPSPPIISSYQSSSTSIHHPLANHYYYQHYHYTAASRLHSKAPSHTSSQHHTRGSLPLKLPLVHHTALASLPGPSV